VVIYTQLSRLARPRSGLLGLGRAKTFRVMDQREGYFDFSPTCDALQILT
jgi:hypothetical protein